MTLYLRVSEARIWNGGVTVWREIPDELQPRIINGLWQIEAPNDKVFKGPTLDPCSIYRTNARESLAEPLASVCPCQPGMPVECKETWALLEGYVYHKSSRLITKAEKYIFKADYYNAYVCTITPSGIIGWRSPILMPRAAVRRHGVIESATATERDGKWWWEIKVKEAPDA